MPVGRPVKLMMGSEDVIHSFYIPAFRVKADVIPGRYNTLWFTATKPGRYHLFCAEYCGTKHSGHDRLDHRDGAGRLPGVAGGRPGDAIAGRRPARSCSRIWRAAPATRRGPQGRGPALAGLFGKTVELQGGGTAVADESYIRESIVNPQAKVVAGFQPIMPTFQGLVSEEQLLQLIAYVRSLEPAGPPPAAPATPPATP